MWGGLKMDYQGIKNELGKNFKFKILNGFYLYYVDGFFHIHTVDEKIYIGDFIVLIGSYLKIINIILGKIYLLNFEYIKELHQAGNDINPISLSDIIN